MTRDIWCDECGDSAVDVPIGALGEDLGGKRCTCQACGVAGKIVWESDADEDGTYTTIRFKPEDSE